MKDLQKQLSLLYSIRFKILARVSFFSRLRLDIEHDYERLYGAYGNEWEQCKEYCMTFEKTYREHAEDCRECYEVLRTCVERRDAEDVYLDEPEENLEELFETSICLGETAKREADEGVRMMRKLCSSIRDLEKECP